MKRKLTFLIAAAVLLLTMMATTGRMWGQTTVASFSRSGTSNTITGGEFTTTFSAKSGYYQDNNGDCYMQILNTSAYWTTTPTSINLAATIGGGSGNKDLTNSVYVVLLDENGDAIGTQTVLTSHITTNTGDDYNISMPIDNDVYGVRISHEKEAGYNVRYYSFSLSFVAGGSTTPSITANDVNLAYDAEGGSIAYTLTNATGNVTAEITSGDWLTLGTVTENTVPFTCSANTSNTTRTATVKLSYTGATDKVVTVTQDAAPVVYTTIPDIFNAATTTETSVNVTFNNWVVSGVSTNGKNVYITDGTNGLIIYYTSDMSATFSAGNILSGENVSCTLKLYNGAAELLNVNAAALTITTGGTITPADIELANLTGVNTGALLHYENLTCTVNNNKYYLTDGTTSIQLYNALYAFTNPTAGNNYNITGVYVQYNTTKEIMPRSAEDLVVVVLPTVETPTFSPDAGTYTSVQNVTIACATDGATIYYTTDGSTPTTSSTVYSSAIEVAETKTIKAIATKAGMTNSEIATAAYTINLPVPTITVTPAIVNAPAAETDGTLTISLSNFTVADPSDLAIQFYDGNNQPLASNNEPNWIVFDDIATSGDNYSADYTIEANTGATRAAYLKAFALGDTDYIYSNLVTINQAAPTYAVTFDVDGGTFIPNADFATINENKTAGTYNLPSATKAGWEFAGWNDGTTTYEANAEYTVSAAVNFTAQWTVITTGTIVFGNNGTKINQASVTGEDSFGNTWTITTEGTTNFSQSTAYSQVGTSSKPATSITFTTTLAQSTTFTAFSAKFGGFNNTAGTVTLKVGETTVGTGSLDGTTDVVVENTTSATGTVLTVTVTDIAKGVKCYYISYTISTGSDPMIIAQNSIELSSTDTYGEFEYSIVNPATGVNLTANSTDEWISNINVTADKVTFETTPNTSETDNREGSITLSYTGAANKVVSVTQSKVDYATMPFEFVGNEDIPVGVTTTAGTYNTSPYLKFDATGKYLVLKVNVAPVSISYDIKGNGFSGGSIFKVQVSADGSTYTDLKTYTELGDTQTVTLINENENVRYIKWIYSDKKSGNVALGNIKVTTAMIINGDFTVENFTISNTDVLTIAAGSVMTVTGTLTNNGDASNLIIEDGGQLIHNGNVNATMKKNVTAASTWNSKDSEPDGWYTIASPVAGLSVACATTGSYDFFKYNEATAEWLNQKKPANNISTFEQGVGYLYANSAETVINYLGTLVGTNSEVTKAMSYECNNANLKGFNLMGNPFSRNLVAGDMILNDTAVTTYYTIEGGSEFVARKISAQPVKPGQGFILQASGAGQNLVFNQSSKDRSTENVGYISIEAGNSEFTDNAFVQIGGGNTLRKMTLSDNSSKVYVINDNKDYAAARINALEGSMPVCFKANEPGVYTITIEPKDLKVDYLHLIDNLTGENIDLLINSEYSFIASPKDNENRFRLAFSANGNNIESNASFAYQNGSDIIVNGEGELQVFDVMGRLVMNQHVNGVQTVNVKANGVYIFKLNENVQKIVVR